jgi:hypothetical protein
VDNAHKKLEIGLEQIYDHVRRPFERLYLKLAVTQNVFTASTVPANIDY